VVGKLKATAKVVKSCIVVLLKVKKTKAKVVKSCIIVSLYRCIVVSKKESCNDIKNWKGVSVVICTGA
jgi:hypothetical protein